MRGVSPDVAEHDWSVPTTIPGRGKAQRSLMQKITHNFYTGRDSLCRQLFNLTRRN
jgi:hypothetical protein